MTDTRQAVVDRHLKGQSNGQIAAALNLSRGTVGGHLFRWRRDTLRQVKPDDARCKWSDDQIETLSRLHAAGATSAAIGEAVGKSSEATRKQGHRMGLSWADRVPRSRLIHTVPNLTEKQIELNQRENDLRMIRALALAFQRGDHIPQAMRDAA